VVWEHIRKKELLQYKIIYVVQPIGASGEARQPDRQDMVWLHDFFAVRSDSFAKKEEIR